jgi:CBS domain containing-hemolysin-like protein
MQLSVTTHFILGIVTMEKVLEAILNMQILDEKDAEKIRN